MSSVEKAVIDLLGDAWNAFQQLPVSHVDDETDFRYAIHAAQRIILARAGRRGDAEEGVNDANS